MGQGLGNDSLPYIFTAAVDYSGNVIWKKKLTIDPVLQPSLKEGYHNLIKLPNGNLVAAGNLYNYPLAGNRTGAQPFLYFLINRGTVSNMKFWPTAALSGR